MIKKFINGNILLDNRKDFVKYNTTGENFYHDDMTMFDLYIVQVNGYLYICDMETKKFYDLPRNHTQLFFEDLEKKAIRLYPYGKKMSKSLFEDMENGY